MIANFAGSALAAVRKMTAGPFPANVLGADNPVVLTDFTIIQMLAGPSLEKFCGKISGTNIVGALILIIAIFTGAAARRLFTFISGQASIGHGTERFIAWTGTVFLLTANFSVRAKTVIGNVSADTVLANIGRAGNPFINTRKGVVGVLTLTDLASVVSADILVITIRGLGALGFDLVFTFRRAAVAGGGIAVVALFSGF